MRAARIAPASRSMHATATTFAAGLVATLALSALAGCGAGGGTESALAPGPTTNAPPGNVVLYVCMARRGRVEAYRLGTDGLLPAEPFSRISRLNNPRRLVLGDGVLYVALEDGLISLQLAADGSLPDQASASTVPLEGLDAQEMILRADILYLAAAGTRSIEQYNLDERGNVPPDPAFVVSGSIPGDFRTLDIAGTFLYAASRNAARVDTFLLAPNGDLPEEVEEQEPDTDVALPDDIRVIDGILHVTDGGGRQLQSYVLGANGLPPNDPETETKPDQFYVDMIFAGDVVYAAAFNKGRIDTYPFDTEAGMFIEDSEPLSETQDDPAAFPTGLALNARVLYVAQAGLGRVDAYIVGADGTLPQFPSSSTRVLDGGFPTDIVLLVE